MRLSLICMVMSLVAVSKAQLHPEGLQAVNFDVPLALRHVNKCIVCTGKSGQVSGYNYSCPIITGSV